MTDCHSIILSIMRSHRGDSNKLTQQQITNECISKGGSNMTDRRTRIILRELIDNGAPIISTAGGGYHWYDTEDERKNCYEKLRHMGLSIFVRARNMNRNCLVEKARKKEMVQLNWLERVG